MNMKNHTKALRSYPELAKFIIPHAWIYYEIRKHFSWELFDLYFDLIGNEMGFL